MREHRHHQNLANRTRLLQLAEDRRKTEERENKQREMHNLLTFVQGQIHGKKAQDLKVVDQGVRETSPLSQLLLLLGLSARNT